MRKFVMNYDAARRYYDDMNWDKASEFGPAYIATNENLRESIKLFSGALDDVLTVAASGDQALHYTLAGAKHVDTFDQTYCAKAIQDIKTAAIPRMYRDPYLKMLDEFHRFGGLMYVDGVHEILSAMPCDTARFVREMDGYNIFGRGLSPMDTPFAPSYIEYAALQNRVAEPFKFIWSDIADLHVHLNQKYDVINVSNIFDWAGVDSVIPTLKKLWPYLKDGGYIQIACFNEIRRVPERITAVVKKLGDVARMERGNVLSREDVFALRKVR